ncbi:ATP-dependent DNA helicase PIF4-like [Camellia sinensis]|uniref:ATP-dependent DNA helicase PIF4-like n=1 Tax=Camellia sinensis TaxID=4442 RepID=UPI001036CD5F|nr:ATP-dependent DNA helicase PIF4-like [Camellia sinensis]
MVLGLINKIQQYLNARYIGPPEAAWRIFGYPLHAEIPTVVRLALHLPGMHRLLFNLDESLENEAQQADAKIIIDRLNNDQRTAYDAITSSVFENKGTIFFLNGGAGIRKTFLYNAIALKCRSLGHIVITVASSGIASFLLIGGRTAHSTFSIPLDELENSICGFSKQSLQAELFRETKLIIWDEVPMQHRHCVEAVDRTFRDTCDSEKPFGGITVVLGGDF